MKADSKRVAVTPAPTPVAEVVRLHPTKRGRPKSAPVDRPCKVEQAPDVVNATAWAISQIPDKDWPGAKEDVRLRADRQKLAPTSSATLSFLLAKLNRKTGKAHHSAKYIAAQIGREERAVRRAFHDLATRGEIQRCQVDGDKRWASRVWVTMIPALVEAASARAAARMERTLNWDETDTKSDGPDKKMLDGPDNGVRQILKVDTDSNCPPSPQGGRERGNKYSDLIKQIRADGKLPVVVEHLIIPLLGSLSIHHPDPLALLRDIRDQRSIAERPAKVLDRLAALLKERRKKLVSTKDVLDLVNEASNGFEMRKIYLDHPSWTAWCEDLKRQGLSKMIRFYEGQGYMMQWTAWPNWHPQYRAELANGRQA